MTFLSFSDSRKDSWGKHPTTLGGESAEKVSRPFSAETADSYACSWQAFYSLVLPPLVLLGVRLVPSLWLLTLGFSAAGSFQFPEIEA